MIIEDTIRWTRGEIVECWSLAILGACFVGLALLYWKTSTSEQTRALIWPFLVAGGLLLVLGIIGIFLNHARLVSFQAGFDANPVAFAAAEKLRVEGFLSVYQYTLATASLLLACGLGLFWLRHTPVSRGISLALVVVGLGILVVDHLSEANAHRYYAALVAQDGAALQDGGAASNIAHSPPNAESDRAQ